MRYSNGNTSQVDKPFIACFDTIKAASGKIGFNKYRIYVPFKNNSATISLSHPCPTDYARVIKIPQFLKPWDSNRKPNCIMTYRDPTEKNQSKIANGTIREITYNQNKQEFVMLFEKNRFKSISPHIEGDLPNTMICLNISLDFYYSCNREGPHHNPHHNLHHNSHHNPHHNSHNNPHNNPHHNPRNNPHHNPHHNCQQHHAKIVAKVVAGGLAVVAVEV